MTERCCNTSVLQNHKESNILELSENCQYERIDPFLTLSLLTLTTGGGIGILLFKPWEYRHYTLALDHGMVLCFFYGFRS
jgi:hypothetical protein